MSRRSREAWCYCCCWRVAERDERRRSRERGGGPFRFIFSGAMDWLGLISSSARALGLGVAGAAVNLSSAPALSAEDISGLVLQSIVPGCIPHVCLLDEPLAHCADVRHEVHVDMALR